MQTFRPRLLAALLALPLLAQAQADYVPLQQRLTPEEMRRTGLDQLSPTQLQALDALLREQRATDVDAVRDQVQAAAPAPEASDRQPIASTVVGEFRGWTDNSHITLANGQTWAVTDTPDHFIPSGRALQSPDVVITPGALGGYRMQVEGVPVRAKVKPVR